MSSTGDQNLSWVDRKIRDRGRRALERQLDYQEDKSAALAATEAEMVRANFVRSQQVRQKIESVRPISKSDKIVEVGSGAHGLVFGIASGFGIGVDPLAVDYKRLFPRMQNNAVTVAAVGEHLPFADGSFDLVLTDNVIDHATRPFDVLDEIIRILKPRGTLYFTVNVHHPLYDLASRAHGLWNAVGLKIELSAFADHTIHLTEKRIADFFAQMPVDVIEQSSTIYQTRSAQRAAPVSSADALLKKMFFKNAVFELLATRR